MKIEKQKLPQLITSFIDTQMIPNASGVQKFATIAVGVMISKKADTIINHEAIQKIGEMSGIIDNQGFIDMEYALEVANETFDKAGTGLNLMGCLFDKEDVQALYHLAEQLQGE